MQQKYTKRFYWKAAVKEIADERCYYKTVHKIGMYEGMRVYKPVLNDEFNGVSPLFGFPLMILVDDEGNSRCVRDVESYFIISEVMSSNNAKRRQKRIEHERKRLENSNDE